jgi:hypothetical protein
MGVVMGFSIANDLFDGLLGVVEAGFDGADGNGQDASDVLDRQVFQEVEGQGFALEEGELVEGVVDLLGIVEGDERACGCGAVFGGEGCVVLGAQAKAADGGIARGGIEERGESAGVANSAERAEDFHPGFLEQVPGVGFARGEAAEIVEEGLFPEVDEAFKGLGVAALASGDEEFGFEDLSIWPQGNSV